LVNPLEANPPLIIDANTVLPLPVASEGFETIARQPSKIPQRSCCIHSIQLEARGSFDSGECLDPFSDREISGSFVPIAENHALPKVAQQYALRQA
jgi:hypothetical protein